MTKAWAVISFSVSMTFTATMAEAQRAISTIGPPLSSATRVSTSFETAARRAGWSFESQTGCTGLRNLLRPGAKIALLTTADCVPELAGAPFDHVTANIGSPALCFTATRRPGEVFVANARILILKGDRSRYKLPLELALKELGIQNPIVDASSSDYEDLTIRFKKPEFNAACVFEDGSGTAGARLLRADGVPVVPPQLGPPGRVVGGAVVVRQQFVAGLWSAGLPGIDSLLTFPLGATIAAPRPSVSDLAITVRVAAAAEPLHSQRPLPGVTPVLYTMGDVPTEILIATRTAILGAAVDGSINPCMSLQQDVYRSFLLGAMSDTLKIPVQIALWEHGTLLDSRNDADQRYHAEKENADYALATRLAKGASLREALDQATSALENIADETQCRAPKRYWFFQPGRVAYYQYGVRRLRDALAATPVNPGSEAFKDASNCLKAAFVHRDRLGREPTCGDRLSGMWTTYYAPYMAWAVIEAERMNAPR